MSRYIVRISSFAERRLRKLPRHIRLALYCWVESVEEFGLPHVRTRPGYHDEPLKGVRQGQRSIRLNRSYRVIYEITEAHDLVVVGIKEISKHEY